MSITDTNVVTSKCECGKETATVLSQEVISSVRTIKCDAPECTNTITYDRKAEKQVFEAPENAWLRSTRVIQTADGRNLAYCSDACTVKGAASGVLNLPVAPAIVPGNAAAVQAAVAAAKAKSDGDAAIRAGKPANIQIAE